MNKIKLRPQAPNSDVEMCTMCDRGVGMVYDTRVNKAPFMCLVCEMRFPVEQWEEDELGCFFDLTNNGGVHVKQTPRGVELHPWLTKENDAT